MSDITICVATTEECDRQCKRRVVKANPYSQSYANFALDYLKDNICEAYIGFSKKYKDIKLKIN